MGSGLVGHGRSHCPTEGWEGEMATEGLGSAVGLTVTSTKSLFVPSLSRRVETADGDYSCFWQETSLESLHHGIPAVLHPDAAVLESHISPGEVLDSKSEFLAGGKELILLRGVSLSRAPTPLRAVSD
jgi:hypothetical protein